MRLYLVYGHVDHDDDESFGRGVGKGGQGRGYGGEYRAEERHYLQKAGQDGEGEGILDAESREADPGKSKDQDHRRDLADNPTGDPFPYEHEDLLDPPPPLLREEREHPVYERSRVGDHVESHHHGSHGLQEQTRPAGGYGVELPGSLYNLLDGVGEVQARDLAPANAPSQGRIAFGEVLEVILDAADHSGGPCQEVVALVREERQDDIAQEPEPHDHAAQHHEQRQKAREPQAYEEVHGRSQDQGQEQRQRQDLDDADELVEQEPPGHEEPEDEREPRRLKEARTCR